MDKYKLYEGAMQVVPLLIIALFVDNRSRPGGTPRSRLGRSLARAQDRVTAVLGFVAFFVSMFVLVGAIGVSRITDAVVVAALGGSVGMLFGVVWRRFAGADEAEKDTDQPDR